MQENNAPNTGKNVKLTNKVLSKHINTSLNACYWTRQQFLEQNPARIYMKYISSTTKLREKKIIKDDLIVKMDTSKSLLW